MKHRDSKRLGRLLLIVLSLFVGLLFAEILVRLTGIAPEVVVISSDRYRLSDNLKLRYEPVPGARTNALGYRDRDHALEKEPGVYRIVVLGDSIVAGFAVRENADLFPAVLERRLRSEGIDAEVISFGVVGYNTEQEVETLEVRGLAYQPDLVLLAYALNDRKRNDGRIALRLRSRAEEQRKRGNVPSFLAQGLASRSALYLTLRFGVPWTRATATEPASALRGAGAGGDPSGDIARSPVVPPAFAELAALARENEFSVVVAVFPWLSKGRDHDTILYDYPPQYDAHHASVERLSSRHGFHHLDLLDPFRECGRKSPEKLHRDVAHPSPYGHRCAGEALAEFILDSVYPPDLGS